MSPVLQVEKLRQGNCVPALQGRVIDTHLSPQVIAMASTLFLSVPGHSAHALCVMEAHHVFAE